jgi:5-carboxymethyl-2-hydroxymuconate isomerase
LEFAGYYGLSAFLSTPPEPMPHCIFEYSSNLKIASQVPEFLSRLNQQLADTGIFTIGQIKSRAFGRDTFIVGNGKNTAFMFLQISLLSGRDQVKKDSIGKTALLLMKEMFGSAIGGVECSVTVELREMSREQHYSLKDLVA